MFPDSLQILCHVMWDVLSFISLYIDVFCNQNYVMNQTRCSPLIYFVFSSSSSLSLFSPPPPYFLTWYQSLNRPTPIFRSFTLQPQTPHLQNTSQTPSHRNSFLQPLSNTKASTNKLHFPFSFIFFINTVQYANILPTLSSALRELYKSISYSLLSFRNFIKHTSPSPLFLLLCPLFNTQPQSQFSPQFSQNLISQQTKKKKKQTNKLFFLLTGKRPA
jgi:hypothetical protein